MHLRWVDADPGIPIMMSATGPRNLRLAGSLADRVMLYVGVEETSVRWAMEHVRAGAEEAGRDPDAVQFSLLTAMWVSDDQEDAWDRCRWAPAACANHIADTMRRNPSHDMPETMTRLAQSRDEYDYYAGHLSSEADHTGYLTGELIDDFALAGRPRRCGSGCPPLRAGHRRDLVRIPERRLRADGTVGREIIPATVATGEEG